MTTSVERGGRERREEAGQAYSDDVAREIERWDEVPSRWWFEGGDVDAWCIPGRGRSIGMGYRIVECWSVRHCWFDTCSCALAHGLARRASDGLVHGERDGALNCWRYRLRSGGIARYVCGN